MHSPLLEVEHLDVTLAQASRPLLHDLSFSLAAQRCLGVVGESGSGKSLLCRAIMGLLPDGFLSHGAIRFGDTDLLALDDNALRRYRGCGISLIPQHPMTAFNPLQSIGQQMVETLCVHLALRPRVAKEKAVALLEQVQLPHAARRINDYPAQLSGGMLQRVAIAIALGLSPQLLIADEPTTALDAVAQADILQLFAELREANAMTMLFVSHDFGVIQRLADEVIVMQHGEIVEQGVTSQLLHQPQHGHTRYLLDARQALVQGYQRWVAPAQTVGVHG